MKMWGYVRELEASQESTHFSFSRSLTLSMCVCARVYFFSLMEDPEKAMAPHSSTLAWKIPWMEAPGRLQSMGSLRVGHD